MTEEVVLLVTSAHDFCKYCIHDPVDVSCFLTSNLGRQNKSCRAASVTTLFVEVYLYNI